MAHRKDIFGVSLRTLGVFMTGTREVSLIGLSLGIPLLSLPKSTNTVAVIGYLFGYLNEMILVMHLGNPLVSLIGYIWHINWCGTWLSTWKLLWNFNWVPSLILIRLGTWHTNFHIDGTFTWKLDGKVSCVNLRIDFAILFGCL